ncbi:DNA/RNA-binding domain of Phe-tRNA-synthetase-like protein [Symbiobacterium terraclitae]|uniref:DNA/RNA-binding domain of Phe-tRNA-synthetase-like protein n=1 Tax=Symbiobacterium terraclitae TaxID=557451 RepID=A0ABS4JUZ3_9FIRM|nr:DNA/RNA-binding domain of Phe-tRNA-synthetase-like protein [Symbiobacterium terraclitae]
MENGPATEALQALVDATVVQTRTALKLEEISQLPAVAGWRKVLKALGTDPSRYRVSSERLLRRIVKGDDLPRVNLMVDLVNAWSVATGLPIGLYDADRLEGTAVSFGRGREGERYLTLAGTELETQGKPVLRDAAGPCGSPLTDSARTATGAGTRRCLAVVFGPPLFDSEEFDRHLDLLCNWVGHFTTGRVVGRSRTGS